MTFLTETASSSSILCCQLTFLLECFIIKFCIKGESLNDQYNLKYFIPSTGSYSSSLSLSGGGGPGGGPVGFRFRSGKPGGGPGGGPGGCDGLQTYSQQYRIETLYSHTAYKILILNSVCEVK